VFDCDGTARPDCRISRASSTVSAESFTQSSGASQYGSERHRELACVAISQEFGK
jgi:hypothetical protein